MSKCKYPNEVCANMTLYHGEVYCDSVPCSLKGEIPPPTNAQRIRSMTDEELAEFLWEQNGSNRYWKSVDKYVDWLQQPAETEG